MWLDAIYRFTNCYSEPRSSDAVCSLHFEPHFYVSRAQRVRLHEDAIPTVFPKPGQLKRFSSEIPWDCEPFLNTTVSLWLIYLI